MLRVEEFGADNFKSNIAMQTQSGRLISRPIELSHTSEIEDVFLSNGREESVDTTTRIAVYALNLCILAFSLPLGLALMIINIFRGESLRMTMQVFALFGLFMALAAAGVVFPLSGF